MFKKITLLLLSTFLHYSIANAVAFQLRPVPWLTEDAIIFLDNFLKTHKNARVLEFGSGASTVWFAKRTCNLISVEHDQEAFSFIAKTLNNSSDCYPVDYRCIQRPYYDVCETLDTNSFDLILVDGRNRKGCILHALKLLKSGGVLMLDNAERKFYHAVFDYMNDWQKVITEQTKPDSCSFWYKGWQTIWWIKP